jgi:hypothetical protein
MRFNGNPFRGPHIVPCGRTYIDTHDDDDNNNQAIHTDREVTANRLDRIIKNKPVISTSLFSQKVTLQGHNMSRSEINWFALNLFCYVYCVVGRDSAVGIATCNGMDRSGIEFRWGRDFPHLSRPSLGRTQPPLQWVPGLSRG